MRAAMLVRHGSPDQAFELVDSALVPRVEKGELLIRVHAAGVSRLEAKIRAGYHRAVYAERGGALPALLGGELAGVVEQVGEGARGFSVGDAVYAARAPYKKGAYAERCAVPATQVAKKPSRLSFVEASTIPYAACTVYTALVDHGGLRPGEGAGKRALVHAGSGGIGSFAIQLLKAWGAWVATTTSRRNVAFVQSLGADQVIDYDKSDYSQTLRNLDLVLDTLGGAHEERSQRLLKKGGAYLGLVHPGEGLCAGEGLGMAGLRRSWRSMVRGLGGKGYAWVLPRLDGAILQEVNVLIQEGAIRPVVEKSYSLEEVVRAHRHLDGGHTAGRVALRVAEAR